jgi:hypothetical protein
MNTGRLIAVAGVALILAGIIIAGAGCATRNRSRMSVSLPNGTGGEYEREGEQNVESVEMGISTNGTFTLKLGQQMSPENRVLENITGAAASLVDKLPNLATPAVP